MATLRDILEQSGNEKTAAQNAGAPAPAATEQSKEEIMKLAAEMGVYNELFPQDAALTNPEASVKTAEEEKVAAYQEALGARAFDYFALRHDQRIEKIAGEIMSSSDLEAAQGIMQPGAAAPQRIPNTQDPAADAAPRIPVGTSATPYAGALQGGAGHGAEGQVGHEEQQKMAACIRKHFLLSQIQ